MQVIMGNVSRPANQAAAIGSSPPVVPGAGNVTPPVPDTPTQGGAQLAAAMAAKLNAMLMAKGKLKPLQPLPSKVPPSVPPPVTNDEIVITEVDINDVPVNCRNLLTKSKTQEEIRQYSGALVSTRGLYMSEPERATYTGGDRPLYLHLQGRTQEQINKAVARIKEIIAEDVIRASGGQQPAVMPPVPVYPQPPRSSVPSQPHLPVPRPPNAPVTPAHRPPPPHAGSFVHTKLFVGLEQSLPNFSVNEKVEGPNGSYLQHIQTETGARVFLRGKGSGYIEQASRRESFEPLYLYISHPNAAGLEAAKKLCESLLETVRAEHASLVSTYTATQPSTQATTAYPSHGYSSNSSYSSQSWYGYPSAYPSYPTTAGSYWSQPDSTDGAQMVQYPVCPRQSTSFMDEGSSTLSDSTSNPNSNSPKRHFLEEGDEEDEKAGVEMTVTEPVDLVKETVCDADGESTSDGVLMPPPPLPPVALLPPLKRLREEPVLTNRGEEEEDEEEDEEVEVKKVKIFEPSALVPYSGDSSDEEEERSKSNA